MSSTGGKRRGADATRDRLLEAGAELFAEKGYHGAGLKEILGRAGTPKGSFYNFFSSKEDFAGAVALQHARAMSEAFESRFAGSDDPPLEILRQAHLAFLDAYGATECARTCITARLALEAGDRESELPVRLRRLLDSWLSRISGLIASAQARGEARDDVPAAELAALFWHSWEGALIHMKLSGDTAPARRSVDLLIGTLLTPTSRTQP